MIVLVPLSLTQTEFTAGDTVRVTVSFKYTVGVDTAVKIFAGPYFTNAVVPFKHMVDQCVGSADVLLAAAESATDKTATVDFPLLPAAKGGIENGLYGLRVWIENTDSVAEQDNVLVVGGNPSGSGLTDMFSAMMPMLMMVMMLGMMAPMMQGMGGEETE